MAEIHNSNLGMRFQNSEYKLEISATDSFIQRYIKTLINNGRIKKFRKCGEGWQFKPLKCSPHTRYISENR